MLECLWVIQTCNEVCIEIYQFRDRNKGQICSQTTGLIPMKTHDWPYSQKSIRVWSIAVNIS